MIVECICAQTSRQAVDVSKVAELEAAQAAAQGALLAEMDLLRRQKAAAEEQARRLETQVCVTNHAPMCLDDSQLHQEGCLQTMRGCSPSKMRNLVPKHLLQNLVLPYPAFCIATSCLPHVQHNFG